MTCDAWLAFDDLRDGRTRMVLGAPHVRFDGQLFGGTGLATAIAVMEAASGREALWATVQFVGAAPQGAELVVTVEELATGGTTSQLEVRAVSDGAVVFTAVGATARQRDGGFAATFHAMPDVPGPDDAAPLRFGNVEPTASMLEKGPFAFCDYRKVTDAHDNAYVWARPKEWTMTAAVLGYLADFVPSAVLAAAGRFGGGTSLDNTIRFGATARNHPAWVLMENQPYFADNGFVHGAARMWSIDGTLLAVASQTAVARLFD